MPLDAPVITMTCSLIGSSSILMRLTPANLSLDRRRQPLVTPAAAGARPVSFPAYGARPISMLHCLLARTADSPWHGRHADPVRRPRASTSAGSDRRSTSRPAPAALAPASTAQQAETPSRSTTVSGSRADTRQASHDRLAHTHPRTRGFDLPDTAAPGRIVRARDQVLVRRIQTVAAQRL